LEVFASPSTIRKCAVALQVICSIIAIVFIGIASQLLIAYFTPLPSLNSLDNKTKLLCGLPASSTDDYRNGSTSSLSSNSMRTPIRSRDSSMFSSASYRTPTTTGVSSMNSPISYQSTSLTTPSRIFQATSTPISSLTSSSFLDSFISQYTSQEEQRTNEDQTTFNHSISNTMVPTATYATSLRMAPPLRSIFHAGSSLQSSGFVEDDSADSNCIDGADNLFRSLRIKQNMTSYVDQLRSWLTTQLIRPIAKEIEDNRKELVALIQTHLFEAALSLTPQVKQLLQQVQEREEEAFSYIVNQYPNRPESIARKNLLKYITVPCEADISVSRSYVSKRYITLAEGESLSLVNWNGGGYLEGRRPWNNQFPTDAAVIMHAFLAFMDERVPQFIQNYYLDAPSNSNYANQRRRNTPFIVQTRRSPSAPYYMVVTRESDQNPSVNKRDDSNASDDYWIWRSEPGRNNVYQCIALYLLCCVDYRDGRIGSIDLTSKSMKNILNILA
jgi:hypothetical protein